MLVYAGTVIGQSEAEHGAANGPRMEEFACHSVQAVV